ncbi:hypothetical protein HOY82DRAFT_630657 [Tuber indicum]|nr:hypothetical protein HOY82DRAFT_630657 [Tuber indicum]
MPVVYCSFALWLGSLGALATLGPRATGEVALAGVSLSNRLEYYSSRASLVGVHGSPEGGEVSIIANGAAIWQTWSLSTTTSRSGQNPTASRLTLSTLRLKLDTEKQKPELVVDATGPAISLSSGWLADYLRGVLQHRV